MKLFLTVLNWATENIIYLAQTFSEKKKKNWIQFFLQEFLYRQEVLRTPSENEKVPQIHSQKIKDFFNT